MKKLIWLGFALCLLIGFFTRFIGLTQFPPSLYWEEAALGYDAYSILKTGHDVHGHFLPLVAFESFGDYKPSFYFYTLVPSIAAFGLTDFAVRFPSALSGVLLIVGVGLLARELGFSLAKKKKTLLPELLQFSAMLVTSLSPWAIEFSRGGWEVNVATTLLTFGMWLQFFIRRKLLDEKNQLRLPTLAGALALSVLLIALSMYTYHATRLVAPILLFLIWAETSIELWLQKKSFGKISFLVGAGLIFSLLISPILFSFRSVETQHRFTETSLFADGRQVKLSNQLIAQSQPQWLGKILYHRYLISGQMILENYLTHFSFKFLFLNGDINPRHSTQFVGLMYTGEVILLLSGLYFLFSKRNPVICLVFAWLLIGVMPAALTTATPHALRILPSLPAWMVILAAGIVQISTWLIQLIENLLQKLNLKEEKSLPLLLAILFFTVFYTWQFVGYWRFYSLIYSKQYASEWQYGYKQMIEDLAVAQKITPNLPVQITREYGRPSMYYWFYNQTDPKLVQAEEKSAKKDQGEFLQFQNVSFVDQLNITQKTLVASSEQTYENLKTRNRRTQRIISVQDLQGKTVWVIYTAE